MICVPALVCVAAACFGAAPALAATAADTVYLNGKVFTADGASKVVEAFAVKGETFIAVGGDAEVRAHAGPQTRVVDLKGAFVVPGLSDAHFHSEGGGPGIDLSKAAALQDLLDTVAVRARSTPAGTIITSNGDWHETQLKERRLPTAADLDRAAPDHPVVLSRGGHEYILNSAALRKWGITETTVSAPGGRIGKDPSGRLNGELIDAAKRLVQLPPAPPLGPADVLRTQQVLNSFGITSVRITGRYKHTAGGPGDLDMSSAFNTYRLLKQVRDSGKMTLRFNLLLRGVTVAGRSGETLARLQESGIRPDEGDAWVRIGGVKLLVDGGFEGGHMFEPYAEPYGRGGAYKGVVILPQPEFIATIDALNDAGWRVSTHAAGDAALEQVLDAYEAIDAKNPLAGKRWAIEHAFLADAGQIDRVRRLGLHLSVQNHLQIAAPAFRTYLGEPRTRRITPLRTYLAAGLNLAGGTDSEIVPVNPFWELHHFLTRDTRMGVVGPDERVTSRPELLRLITINYARLTGEDAIKGSIEPGKLADFAVLSEDFLTVAPEKIEDMRALATYVGGREVYRAPGSPVRR